MRGKEERGWRWGETGGALGFGPGRGPTQCFPPDSDQEAAGFSTHKVCVFQKISCGDTKIARENCFSHKDIHVPASVFSVWCHCSLNSALCFRVSLCAPCRCRADALLCLALWCAVLLLCMWCALLCCWSCSAVFPSECHDFCFWAGTK